MIDWNVYLIKKTFFRQSCQFFQRKNTWSDWLIVVCLLVEEMGLNFPGVGERVVASIKKGERRPTPGPKMQTRKLFINEEQTFLIIWADFITNVLTPNNQIAPGAPDGASRRRGG